MKDRSLASLGSICCILLGVCTALGAILFLLLPPEQRLLAKAPDILPSFAKNPTILTLELIDFAIIGVLGLAVVPAVSEMVKGLNEGWVRWTSNLAYVGFALYGISNFQGLARLPRIAAAFVAGDASTKAALAPLWRVTLDTQGWFGFGGVGAWILVVSLLALRIKAFPRPLVYVGVVLAVANWLVPVAEVFQIDPLFNLVAVLGVIFGTVWYIWVGLTLRQTATY